MYDVTWKEIYPKYVKLVSVHNAEDPIPNYFKLETILNRYYIYAISYKLAEFTAHGRWRLIYIF